MFCPKVQDAEQTFVVSTFVIALILVDRFYYRLVSKLGLTGFHYTVLFLGSDAYG